MQKRAFLIHGWEGYPEEGWRPWLRDELKKEGFLVEVPEMPDTNHPKLKDWLSYLQKIVGKATPDDYFVGHSLGCIAILRYFETLAEDEKVGGSVLVAGFTDDLGNKEINTFFEKPIDWEKINKVCSSFVAIISDNDPYVALKYGDIFKEKLGAKLIVEHNMKHFSGDDGITTFPSAKEAVLSISS